MNYLNDRTLAKLAISNAADVDNISFYSELKRPMKYYFKLYNFNRSVRFTDLPEKIAGPGRLTKQLQIDRKLNGAPAVPASGLHIEDHGIKVPHKLIITGPRVGVHYAGPVWAAKPWRFQIDPTKLKR